MNEKNNFPTFLGEGAPSFRIHFRRKVLPQSYHSSRSDCTSRGQRLWLKGASYTSPPQLSSRIYRSSFQLHNTFGGSSQGPTDSTNHIRNGIRFRFHTKALGTGHVCPKRADDKKKKIEEHRRPSVTVKRTTEHPTHENLEDTRELALHRR